jgi:hypothetical protein
MAEGKTNKILLNEKFCILSLLWYICIKFYIKRNLPENVYYAARKFLYRIFSCDRLVSRQVCLGCHEKPSHKINDK